MYRQYASPFEESTVKHGKVYVRGEYYPDLSNDAPEPIPVAAVDAFTDAPLTADTPSDQAEGQSQQPVGRTARRAVLDSIAQRSANAERNARMQQEPVPQEDAPPPQPNPPSPSGAGLPFGDGIMNLLRSLAQGGADSLLILALIVLLFDSEHEDSMQLALALGYLLFRNLTHGDAV